MDQTPLLKIIIAGDDGVGKTSLVRQLREGRFDPSPSSTIGADFQTHLVQLPDALVKLSIWDMAGQERFEVVRAGFYRGSLATALVYDLTTPDSLKSLARWYKEVLQVVPHQRFLVVGNKSDLSPEATDATGRQLAAVIHAEHVRTSALTGQGVAEMFEKLAMLALGSLPAQGSSAPAA